MNTSRLAQTILGMFLIMNGLHAQPWLKPSITSSTSVAQKPNLNDLSRQFEMFWKDKEVSENEDENASEGGYQQFKRWEWLMKSRTYPRGDFFPSDVLFNEFQKIKAKTSLLRTSTGGPTWSFIGPAVIPSSGGGVGRVNVIRFDPANSSIVYIGTACGGIWKSLNGGSTWSNLSDFLPSLSVADIAINPRYTDSIYVATGDGYGYETGDDFWGGLYTAGILVSGDAGQTWAPIGGSRTQDQREIIQRLVMNPVQPEIMLKATRSGLFRSVNAGATWSFIRAGHFYDIEYRANSNDTVYATNGAGVFRSVNRGQNFTQLNASLCGGRASISVTVADPNTIYFLCQNGNLYKSINGGVTMTPMTAPSTLITFYGYYDCVLAVSPVNANIVFCAGKDVARSTDGGTTWQMAANNSSLDYVHVDFHSLEFVNATGELWSGTDGGAYKTINNGLRWTDLSTGLAIKQYYRISHSGTDPYLIYGGAQDNGTDRLKAGSWKHVTGGDGMDNVVNYNDDNHVITSSQNGNFYVSSNGGTNFQSVSNGSGDWITPIIVDPVDPSIFYTGYSEVFKSTDHGYTWNPISSFGSSDNLIALAASGSQTIYAASLGKMYATYDGGQNWSNISAGLPNAAITSIAVSATDPLDVWVSFSGYNSNVKVYHSTDGGIRWQNFSTGFPNLPVNCLAINPYATDGVFAGTDIGMYYTEAGSDWTAFGAGFPNVIVCDLDVISGINKIRAGTYGRGIWEADLPISNAITEDGAVLKIENPQGELCSTTFSPVVTIKNYGSNDLNSFQLNYGIDGDTSQVFNWIGTLAQNASASVTLPAITTTDGSHSFEVYGSVPNGMTDQNAINNYRISSLNIYSIGVALPVTEGFENGTLNGLADFSILNSGNMLYTFQGGGFGISDYSLKADFYNANAGTAVLATHHLDFTNAIQPIGMSFDYAYAPYSAAYHDSLFVLISTDCGTTFTSLFAKGDDSLATAAARNSAFVSMPGDWRQVVLDLTSYAGQQDVMIRMEMKSGFGNNLYLDNINIADNFNEITSTDKTEQIAVFPNPFQSAIQVVFNSKENKNYSISIRDISGRVLQTRVEKGGGFKNISLPADQLASGMYIVTITENGSYLKSVKLVK